MERAKTTKKQKVLEHLTNLGIVTSLGGTVTETAEAIKNKMACE